LYLDVSYGWDKIMKLIKTGDYNNIFGKSEKDIYFQWVDYLKNYYQ
jgi:hypothetical protein